MKRARLVLGLVALAAVAAAWGAAALAQEPFQADRARLLAIFRTLDHGEKAFLSGQVRHLDSPDARPEPYPDRRVVLEESPHPHAAWTAVAETTTDQEGYFSFTREPGVHTRYRVRTEDPPLVSEEPLVRVRMLVAMRAERSRLARGARLRLAGTVTPAHDGQQVLIQRKDARGRFQTVRRVRLVAAPGGGASAFRTSLRASRSGEYRARTAGDADHLPGTSDGLVVTVVAPRGR